MSDYTRAELDEAIARAKAAKASAKIIAELQAMVPSDAGDEDAEQEPTTLPEVKIEAEAPRDFGTGAGMALHGLDAATLGLSTMAAKSNVKMPVVGFGPTGAISLPAGNSPRPGSGGTSLPLRTNEETERHAAAMERTMRETPWYASLPAGIVGFMANPLNAAIPIARGAKLAKPLYDKALKTGARRVGTAIAENVGVGTADVLGREGFSQAAGNAPSETLGRDIGTTAVLSAVPAALLHGTGNVAKWKGKKLRRQQPDLPLAEEGGFRTGVLEHDPGAPYQKALAESTPLGVTPVDIQAETAAKKIPPAARHIEESTHRTFKALNEGYAKSQKGLTPQPAEPLLSAIDKKIAYYETGPGKGTIDAEALLERFRKLRETALAPAGTEAVSPEVARDLKRHYPENVLHQFQAEERGMNVPGLLEDFYQPVMSLREAEYYSKPIPKYAMPEAVRPEPPDPRLAPVTMNLRHPGRGIGAPMPHQAGAAFGPIPEPTGYLKDLPRPISPRLLKQRIAPVGDIATGGSRDLTPPTLGPSEAAMAAEEEALKRQFAETVKPADLKIADIPENTPRTMDVNQLEAFLNSPALRKEARAISLSGADRLDDAVMSEIVQPAYSVRDAFRANEYTIDPRTGQQALYELRLPDGSTRVLTGYSASRNVQKDMRRDMIDMFKRLGLAKGDSPEIRPGVEGVVPERVDEPTSSGLFNRVRDYASGTGEPDVHRALQTVAKLGGFTPDLERVRHFAAIGRLTDPSQALVGQVKPGVDIQSGLSGRQLTLNNVSGHLDPILQTLAGPLGPGEVPRGEGIFARQFQLRHPGKGAAVVGAKREDEITPKEAGLLQRLKISIGL